MKIIKILGTGCPKCKQTEAVVRQVLAQTNTEAQVEKVEDIQEIMNYQVLSTPAVVVDGVVKIEGRVPSAQEVQAALR